MTNNEQLLKYDENIGLYDHINPILNLKDLNRKQVKELAKEIANNKSQTHSWQEVLNDAVNYDSKNKRQEKRFKRIFNKQLNENLTPILEKQHKQELIDRMKSGDASAMSQWTTEGIDKFGHQFIPVMLTAATLPFGIGAFGQAANTIGSLPALGAETGSWGLGYGGYKLGSKLDDDFGTNWIAPALSVASGIGGYGAGYKGMAKLGSKGWLPKNNDARTLYGDLFVKDVGAAALTRQLKKAPSKTMMDYYRDYNFLFSELTDPDRFVHVSPNPISGKNASVGAAHSNGINWVPGNAHVSKVGDDNMVWLWTGKPYRNRSSDQTFISIPKTEGMIQTRQPGAVGVPQIDLTHNTTKIITKNPITGGFERQLVVSPAQSSKGSYAFFERPSKLTLAERMGIPKGERNWDTQMGIARNTRDLEKMQQIRDAHFLQKSGTVAINEDGTVLLFAHTTPNKFTIFDKTKFGLTDEGYHGKGFYFSPTRVVDDAYTIKLLSDKGKLGPRNTRPLANYGKNWMYGYLQGTEFKPGRWYIDTFDNPENIIFTSSDDPLKSSEFIIGNSSQFKLAAPEAFDDAGHFIKLSKRDDFNNPDIRFKKGGKIK